MPTKLKRVFVPLEQDEYVRLSRLAKVGNESLSGLLHRLVVTSLGFVEDLALGRLANDRLKAFDPKRSIGIDRVIKRNAGR